MENPQHNFLFYGWILNKILFKLLFFSLKFHISLSTALHSLFPSILQANPRKNHLLSRSMTSHRKEVIVPAQPRIITFRLFCKPSTAWSKNYKWRFSLLGWTTTSKDVHSFTESFVSLNDYTEYVWRRWSGNYCRNFSAFNEAVCLSFTETKFHPI